MNVTVTRTSSGAPKFLNCALSSIESYQEINEGVGGNGGGGGGNNRQPQEVNYGNQ